MPDYVGYFLATKSSVVYLETLEISHPSFSKTYRIVRNAIGGLTATLETSAVVTFDYYPLRMKPVGISDDLDQTLQVDLGDLGQIVPMEIDNASAAGTMGTKPKVVYRAYRSDDLSAPISGPLNLEMQDISLAKEGASFEAKAPSLNVNRTGELYKVDRFPMLRGFQ